MKKMGVTRKWETATRGGRVTLRERERKRSECRR